MDSSASPGRIRVGTDLCSVQAVADSVATFGDRYLRRIYTDHELEYCGTDPARANERLAARFAAKEAAVKVLRPVDVRPNWLSIEVRRDPGGWCELSLTGSAAEMAEQASIGGGQGGTETCHVPPEVHCALGPQVPAGAKGQISLQQESHEAPAVGSSVGQEQSGPIPMGPSTCHVPPEQ